RGRRSVVDHGRALRAGRRRGGHELGLVCDRQRRRFSDHRIGCGGARRRGSALRRHDRGRHHRHGHGAERRGLGARIQRGRGFRHPGRRHGPTPARPPGQARRAGGGRVNTYYAANLLIYAGVDIIALLALNLQFGVSGIVNFSFIVFQAAGAYTAAVLSLPPDSANGGFQIYFGGYQLPFPLPWLGGAVAGGLLSIPVGLVVLRKLRSDYQAIALLVLSIITNEVITNARPLLNGAAGLALVPPPFSDQIDPNTQSYQFLYVGITAVCVGLVFVLASRVVNSPYGRSLRALLVPVGFEELTRFIPATIGPPGLIPALQWVAIGLLIIGFLWFRPDGVRPEPRRVFEGAPVIEDVDRARRS